jgi:hypothetical protein
MELIFLKKRPIKEKYVVIGPQSTAGCKEWPYANWLALTKLLNSTRIHSSKFN